MCALNVRGNSNIKSSQIFSKYHFFLWFTLVFIPIQLRYLASLVAMYVLPRAGSPTMQITCGAAIALRRRVDSLRIGDPSAGALPQQILHQLRQL
jgi:hypothetical protein